MSAVPVRVSVKLHGSLAFTGKGHASDRAVILGLLGMRPDTLDPDAVESRLEAVDLERRTAPDRLGEIRSISSW